MRKNDAQLELQLVRNKLRVLDPGHPFASCGKPVRRLSSSMPEARRWKWSAKIPICFPAEGESGPGPHPEQQPRQPAEIRIRIRHLTGTGVYLFST